MASAATLPINSTSRSVTPRGVTSIPPRNFSRFSRTPRSSSGTPRGIKNPEYDARLDNHHQTYVLSPKMMYILRKSMDKKGVFSDPSDKLAFHGPRRPLLLSFPTTPRQVGRAVSVEKYKRISSVSPCPGNTRNLSPIPQYKEGKEAVTLVYNLRTGHGRNFNAPPKKLSLCRAKNVPPSQTKATKLVKEKGFVLDGIALSSIQDNYSKVQPKLGPAIPPYNSHYDKHVQSYFEYQGLEKTLKLTRETKNKSESLQGKAVDKFHNTGEGHEYMYRRNRSGAGYSNDLIDGHDQFLNTIRPMSGYNGEFGFRRNTPILRYCPSPFGTASRSSTF